ncbi:hypothetical protein SCP_0111220 [Sparassis crispa]|uniref:Uncharacterized protein n=1 Tax=Sparassis crispa TaxID=139825 RepID=A0A401G7V9_9APHY|nr:hypothetical protein SCP_0111220 [Sparassis crispa]GBE78239.1 hypothetical protein SCP_0111220 [Sparassis crispa]
MPATRPQQFHVVSLLSPSSLSPLSRLLSTPLVLAMAIEKEPGQKGVNWSNIAVGGIMNMVYSFHGLFCVRNTH